MFGNQSFQAVGFSSSWKTELSTENSNTQTEECLFEDKENQSVVARSIEVQTDDISQHVATSPVVDYAKLSEFLNRIVPQLLVELDKKSQAFESYEFSDDESDEALKKLYTLEPVNDEKYQNECKVSCIAWSCTGRVIAVALAFIEHVSWCSHSSSIYLYNIDKLNNSEWDPFKKLETSSCITSLAAHPQEPSIFAAGTYSGEIIVWSLQRDDDCVIGSSSDSPISHQDTITQVLWIQNPEPGHIRPVLATSGADGRLFLWQVGHHSGSLKLTKSFLITQDRGSQTRLQSPLSSVRMDIGVTCFSFSMKDPSVFIVGVEGGRLLHCSTLTNKPAIDNIDSTLLDPVLSSYDQHQGSVISIKCGTELPNIFLSCGTDNEIRVYKFQETIPIQTIHTSSSLLGLNWWPSKRYLFVVWGTSGCTEFYNLRSGDPLPTLILIDDEKSVPVGTLSFNPASIQLIALGDARGKVTIWKIPRIKEKSSP